MFTHLKRFTWKASLMGTLISLVVVTVVLAASGDLDTTFDGDGKVTTNVVPTNPNRWDEIRGLAIQPNGKIAAAGYSEMSSTSSDFALARYNSNGTLDTTFSGDGRLITNFGGYEFANSVAIQPDGKIIATGLTCTGGNSTCDVALARYNPGGGLDTTFSGDGKVITDFGGDHNIARKVVLQLDGKIVLAGFMFKGGNYDMAVYRYNADGTLDTTFSGDGMVSFNFGAGKDDIATDMDIQDSDGKIVVAGYSGDLNFENNNFAIARLKPNGALDTMFSGDGKQTTDFGGNDLAHGFAGQADGRMVLVGEKIDSISRVAVARYNTNGSLDTTFNITGKKVFSMIAGRSARAWDVIVQSNGKIVLAGNTDNPADDGDFILVRLNSGGGFDTTFSGDGKLTVDFTRYDHAFALALQSDGKYVLGGTTGDNGVPSDFALARVLP